MEFRKLGDSGIDVSVFALGCWPFAGGAVWGEQRDEDSIATVHASLDNGINFFDTAEGYGDGRSEEVLGRALRGRRGEAVIATKVSPSHLTPDGVRASCEASLQRLQTDYIDLYQIHWPNHDVPVEESARALEDLKSAGKIRAVGCSNFAVRDLSDLVAAGSCETNQLPYSLVWRAIEPEILPACQKHNVGIICYSPLAQGVLTGRYASADEVPDGLARTRLYSKDRPMSSHGEPGFEEGLFEAVAAVREISEGLGESMAAVSLAWVRQQPGVTSLLIGARKPEELHLNLPAATLQLSRESVAKLSDATEAVKAYLGNNADPWNSPSRMR